MSKSSSASYFLRVKHFTNSELSREPFFISRETLHDWCNISVGIPKTLFAIMPMYNISEKNAIGYKSKHFFSPKSTIFTKFNFFRYRSRYGRQPSALRNRPAMQGFRLQLQKFFSDFSIIPVQKYPPAVPDRFRLHGLRTAWNQTVWNRESSGQGCRSCHERHLFGF